MQFMASVNIARVMAYRGKGSRPGERCNSATTTAWGHSRHFECEVGMAASPP
jgi:hypothetical protein